MACDGCPAGTTVVEQHCKLNGSRIGDVGVLRRKIEGLSRRRLVGDPANMKETRAYAFCGRNDGWHMGGMQKVGEFFRQFHGGGDREKAEKVRTNF